MFTSFRLPPGVPVQRAAEERWRLTRETARWSRAETLTVNSKCFGSRLVSREKKWKLDMFKAVTDNVHLSHYKQPRVSFCNDCLGSPQKVTLWPAFSALRRQNRILYVTKM